MTTTTPTTTYEYPGYLVIHAPHDGGDVVIGEDGDDWECVAYRAEWATNEDSGEPVGRALMRIGYSEDADGNVTRNDELCDPKGAGSAIVESNAAGADDVYVRLPGGSCVLITRGHVFAYWCDDGGACTGIIHRLPDGGGECDDLGCDESLIG